jgi:hypothetical protein
LPEESREGCPHGAGGGAVAVKEGGAGGGVEPEGGVDFPIEELAAEAGTFDDVEGAEGGVEIGEVGQRGEIGGGDGVVVAEGGEVAFNEVRFAALWPREQGLSGGGKCFKAALERAEDAEVGLEQADVVFTAGEGVAQIDAGF